MIRRSTSFSQRWKPTVASSTRLRFPVALYLLDTEHVSLFQRGDERVRAQVLSRQPDELGVAIVTVEEQLRGRLAQVRRAARGADLVRAYGLLQSTVLFYLRLRIYGFDAEAERLDHLMRQQSPRIGTQDRRIAAIALASGAVLLTRNRSDFEQIRDLSTDDWSNPHDGAA